MKVNIFSDFNGPIGYATHAREFALELSKLVDVHCLSTTPLRLEEVGSKMPRLISLMDFDTLDFSAIGIAITYGMPSYLALFCGEKRIAYTVWELPRLPQNWIFALNQMDGVWVPSTWCETNFKAAGVKGVKVVPEGVDITLFNPFQKPFDDSEEGLPTIAFKEKFTFGVVGKWEKRKAQDVIVKAFAKAFTPEEPVQLILHCTNPFIRDMNIYQQLWRLQIGRAADIKVGAGFFDAQELPRFYRTFGCFVLPSRAEGFGLPILEAMACGLPVITTGVTGHADFVDKDVAYLVKTEKTPVHDDRFYGGYEDTWWYEPDVDHLAELMRYVYENQEEAKEKGRAAYERAKKWTWERGAKKAVKLMEKM